MTFYHKKDKGFTLLIAIVITATLLLVSTGIVSVAVKEAFLSASARESQHAFYAADTGIECAIYWDVRNETGISAFATSTQSQINCNLDNEGPFTVGGPSGVSTFVFDFDSTNNPYCARVTVTKNGNQTTIESRGYNTCDPLNRRRVERAVRIRY
jgi:Tfp pilus assembly protein PilX